MSGRQYTPRERRLISEYLAQVEPSARVIYNARLGPIPFVGEGLISPTIEKALISNKQMFVDAVVVRPSGVEFWEAKIILTGAAIGQLLEYQAAATLAPIYLVPPGVPVSLHIVAAFARPTAVALAQRHAISVVIHTPSWIIEDSAAWDASRSRPIDAASATVANREAPASASR